MSDDKRNPTSDQDSATAVVREKANQLARHLPRYAIRAVINEVSSAAGGNQDRATTIRSVLIDHFNKQRPLKARRLFTSLFEPYLFDDAVLLRAGESVPGLFQRVDMGGLWAALTRSALRTIADEVQAKLDELSRDTLVDDVLGQAEALAMREAMAREAQRYLDELPSRRKLMDEFLAIANREALRDAQKRIPGLTRKARIDAASLAMIAAVLRAHGALSPIITRLRATVPEVTADNRQDAGLMNETERALTEAGDETAEIILAGERLELLRWVPALQVLHTKRSFEAVLRCLIDGTNGIALETHILFKGLLSHFEAACLTIVETLDANLRVDGMGDDQPIALPEEVRSLLSVALDRFHALLSMFGAGGALAGRAIAPRTRPLFAEVTAAVDLRVLPVITARMHAALVSRDDPAPDHEDAIWLAAFIRRWGGMLGQAGYATPEMKALRTSVLRDAESVFQWAIRLEYGEDPGPRLDHLVRINAILAAVGDNVFAWLSPMSQGLQQIVRHHLRPDYTPTDDTLPIIEMFMRAVRIEITRSPRWISPDLLELAELHSRWPHRAAAS